MPFDIKKIISKDKWEQIDSENSLKIEYNQITISFELLFISLILYIGQNLVLTSRIHSWHMLIANSSRLGQLNEPTHS